MTMDASAPCLLLLCVVSAVSTVQGHGILLDPPGRSSIWRNNRFPYGSTLVNNNDTELFCGGFEVQYLKNGGKCGICGDPYDAPHPRPHEAGGMYAQGVIAGTYNLGDVINVTIRLTANHMGHYLFKLCPNNDFTTEVTQECLDRHPVKFVSTSESGRKKTSDKYPVKYDLDGDHKVSLQLPHDVTCSQCVLQWTYVTGHSWGCDDDGTCGPGHGQQELFVNCADIRIEDPNANRSPFSPRTPSAGLTTSTTPTTRKTTTTADGSGKTCRGVGLHAGKVKVDEWCSVNCGNGHCPPSHCKCT